MRNMLLALACCLAFCCECPTAVAQLGTVQVLGPYQPVPFSPRLYYYNPSAWGYGGGYGGYGYGAYPTYGCYDHPTPYELWRDEAILSELRDIEFAAEMRRTMPEF